jgi:hypothetical protein
VKGREQIQQRNANPVVQEPVLQTSAPHWVILPERYLPSPLHF